MAITSLSCLKLNGERIIPKSCLRFPWMPFITNTCKMVLHALYINSHSSDLRIYHQRKSCTSCNSKWLWKQYFLSFNVTLRKFQKVAFVYVSFYHCSLTSVKEKVVSELKEQVCCSYYVIPMEAAIHDNFLDTSVHVCYFW